MLQRAPPTGQLGFGCCSRTLITLILGADVARARRQAALRAPYPSSLEPTPKEDPVSKVAADPHPEPGTRSGSAGGRVQGDPGAEDER